MNRPVSSSSNARDAPTRRGSIHDTPMSQPERPIADERHVEPRARGRDANVARQCEREAAARRPAPFTAAMIGCGIARIFGTSPAISFCTVMPACTRPSPCARGGARALGEVEPRAEPTARTGEHDHAAAAVVGQCVERVVQARDQCVRSWR